MTLSLYPINLINGMGAKDKAARLWCDPLNATIEVFGINQSPKLAASFLAQVAQESGALEHARELWGPTKAQKRYEGRKDLGNTHPGDGKRFMGHGLIQITGRFNHRKVTAYLRQRYPDCPDFEADPEQLTVPPWGALSAGAFWDWSNLNKLGDRGDTLKITLTVNGGLNGFLQRRNYYRALLAELS